MKRVIVLICGVSLLLILGFSVLKMSGAIAPDPAKESSTVTAATGCLPEADVVKALESLSKARTEAEMDRIRETILVNSRKSAQCRSSVIATLMKALETNLDFEGKPEVFDVWRNGAGLLGDLKAVEALDLLISHLDLTDGVGSTTMSHHPALRAVIDIGQDAIPKLEDVLRRSSDANMRNYAVYCISAIGGPSALNALKQALPSESDQCVNKFIRVSINGLDNKDYRLKENVKWYVAFICQPPG